MSYFVVFFSALGAFDALGFFGDGNTMPAVVCASILLWALHFMVCRGVHGAAFINTVTTVAKLVPLALFIGIVIFAFNVETFNLGFWGSPTLGSVVDQVKSTMLVTTWVFIGIEGASVFSSRAENMRDVGKATMIGFALSIVMFVAVTLLSMGILTQPELAALKNPSTAGVLKAAVGDWGATLMNIGLVISVGGALLAWTLLAGEAAYLAGKDGTMPAAFGRLNKNGSPANALWLTNGCIQVFLIITLFNSAGYLALLSLATSMILIPYFLCALYALIIVLKSDGYEAGDSKRLNKDLLVSLVASVYGMWLLYAAGPKYLFLSMILYAVGLPFYLWARREQKERPFTSLEGILAAIVLVLGAYAAYELGTGALSL